MRELSPVMPVDVPENHVTHCITTYIIIYVRITLYYYTVEQRTSCLVCLRTSRGNTGCEAVRVGTILSLRAAIPRSFTLQPSAASHAHARRNAIRPLNVTTNVLSFK